jgi:hypothetical protein
MTKTRWTAVVSLAFVLFVAAPPKEAARAQASKLPSALIDREFWTLASDMSEPNGSFRSDNLLSNEGSFQQIIPDLIAASKPGGVYLGVGPEQNFTYIAATKPAMAFIIDVRRGNLNLHLMYKALFELSADRGEFLSRLFSRPQPLNAGARSTVSDLFEAFSSASGTEELYQANLTAIRRQLLVTHRFALSDEDLKDVEHVYRAFFTFGPDLRYWSTTGGAGYARSMPSYADLMTGTDGSGTTRAYLSSDAAFAAVKDLEARNMLVPVVGNFAGPKAIRAIGAYLKPTGAVVSAFYLSNVEQFLRQEGTWSTFCQSVATLPLDKSSTFIRASRGTSFSRGFGPLRITLGAMAEEVRDCGN